MRRNYKGNKGIKWVLLFIASFAAGVFIMNAKKETLLYESGFLGEYTLMCMKYAEPENGGYLWYLLQRRAGLCILLAFISSTYLGMVGICAYIAWYGFAIGTFLTGAMLRYGTKGLLLFFGSIFPQCILLIPVEIFFLGWCYRLCSTLYYPARCSETFYGNKKQFITRKVIQFQMILAVVAVNCLLECYVNPYIITKILKKF